MSSRSTIDAFLQAHVLLLAGASRKSLCSRLKEMALADWVADVQLHRDGDQPE